MPVEVITIGESVARETYPKLNDAAVAISTGATVTASVQSCDPTNPTIHIAPVTIVHTDAGNDWPNGVVFVEFTAAQTANVPAGRQILRVTVTDGSDVSKYSESVDFEA